MWYIASPQCCDLEAAKRSQPLLFCRAENARVDDDRRLCRTRSRKRWRRVSKPQEPRRKNAMPVALRFEDCRCKDEEGRDTNAGRNIAPVF